MAKKISSCFPFKIKDFDVTTIPEWMKQIADLDFSSYLRVGPKEYVLSKGYRQEAADIYNMPLRPTDVFVNAFPRSGTTWTKELIWLIANDMDFEKAKAVINYKRVIFLENKTTLNWTNVCEEKMKTVEPFIASSIEERINVASPRIFQSHLALSLLPPALLDTARLVYVARDPRDVIVSNYYFTKHLFHNVDLKTYLPSFIENKLYYSPYFEHVKEAWQLRNHPRVLFLFYEELVQDLPSVVHRVASFLGKQCSEQQVAQLCEYLHFDNFKNNPAVNQSSSMRLGISSRPKNQFIRKGKAGGWREEFDDEMTKRTELWMEENLRDTDLRFPQLELRN